MLKRYPFIDTVSLDMVHTYSPTLAFQGLLKDNSATFKYSFSSESGGGVGVTQNTENSGLYIEGGIT